MPPYAHTLHPMYTMTHLGLNNYMDECVRQGMSSVRNCEQIDVVRRRVSDNMKEK
jgi:hypothetical protein